MLACIITVYIRGATFFLSHTCMYMYTPQGGRGKGIYATPTGANEWMAANEARVVYVCDQCSTSPISYFVDWVRGWSTYVEPADLDCQPTVLYNATYCTFVPLSWTKSTSI